MTDKTNAEIAACPECKTPLTSVSGIGRCCLVKSCPVSDDALCWDGKGNRKSAFTAGGKVMTELSDYKRLVEKPMRDSYEATIRSQADRIEADAVRIAALEAELTPFAESASDYDGWDDNQLVHIAVGRLRKIAHTLAQRGKD